MNEQRLHSREGRHWDWEATEKTSRQEMVVAGPWVTLGCSGGHAPSLCPLSDLGQASPGCSEFIPVVSASEVAAGGWTSL